MKGSGPGGVPKKIDSPEGGAGLTARRPGRGRERAFGAIRAFRPARMRQAGALDLLLRAGASEEAHQARLWDAAGRYSPARPAGAGTAGRDVPARQRSAVVADKTVLKMMGEMGLRCGAAARTDLPQVQLVQGVVGETSNVIGRDFAADARGRRWAPTSPVQVLVRQGATLAPALRLQQRRDRRLVDIRVAEHGAAGRDARQLLVRWCPPRIGDAVRRSWRTERQVRGKAARRGLAEHVAQGNCLDNACTEGLFGHMKDEFFRGATGTTSSRSRRI